MRSIKTLALAAATLATLSGSASAEIIDLSTSTCSQFIAMNKEDIGVILMWLDGYYKEEKDPPVINTASFEKNGKRLGDYCRANPKIGLITAADKLFSK